VAADRDKLTKKQETFCRQYVTHGNASRAYREAYDAENMSGPTVNQTAHELRWSPKIRARVRELDADCAELIGVSKSRNARTLAAIAYAELPGILQYDRVSGFCLMRIESFNKLSPEQRKAIKKVKAQTVYTRDNGDQVNAIEVELKDDLKALAELNKMFGYNAPTKTDITSGGKALPPTLNFVDTDKPKES